MTTASVGSDGSDAKATMHDRPASISADGIARLMRAPVNHVGTLPSNCTSAVNVAELKLRTVPRRSSMPTLRSDRCPVGTPPATCRCRSVSAGLPPAAAQAATDSVGAALRVASRLPAEAAAGLAAAAKAAFTDAFGIAVLVSAGTALVGAVLIAKFMPARHLPDWESVEPGGSPTASDLARPSQERRDGKVQGDFETRKPQARPTSRPGG